MINIEDTRKERLKFLEESEYMLHYFKELIKVIKGDKIALFIAISMKAGADDICKTVIYDIDNNVSYEIRNEMYSYLLYFMNASVANIDNDIEEPDVDEDFEDDEVKSFKELTKLFYQDLKDSRRSISS